MGATRTDDHAGQDVVAHFTPMHAGTFMYHSHMDDQWQIPAALAGALLVLEPGHHYDASTDMSS